MKFPLQTCAAGVLLPLLAFPVSPAALAADSKATSPEKAAALAAKDSTAQIQGDERILHVLGRLTFGPRPGDLEAVKAMGLDAWIDRQLSPQKIDDSKLEQRLADYSVARLTSEQLLVRFPPLPVIRLAEQGKVAIPNDPVERAIYEDQIALYRQKREQKKDDGAEGAKADAAAMKDDSAMDADGMKAGGSRVSDPKLAEIVELAPAERMRRLLAMQPQELRGLRTGLTGGQRLKLVEGLSPAQRETLVALVSPRALVSAEVAQTKLLNEIYSERQLQAVMTDFWVNHFNVYINKNQVEPYYLAEYERDVIRPRALGKFEDLLTATAQSKAMLLYLDNAQSVGPDSLAAERPGRYAKGGSAKPPRGLNENYARELMELHTLGVNGGYTQKDVTEVAKVFTGWTLDRPGDGGGYTFNARRHEPGEKTVLGRTIRQSGENEGREVLHLLATSPATAHFVSNKIAMRFVSDTPPAALVDRMAETFLKTDGDIREVLRTMLKSPEFWSRESYRAKVKTPQEFVVSAVRASGAEIRSPETLVQAAAKLGMPVYGMQPPTGYSMQAEAWVNSGALVERMNFALALAGNRLPGVVTDWNSEMGPGAAGLSASAKEQRLEQLLLHGHVAPKTHETVLKQVMSPAVATVAVSEFQMKGKGAVGDPFGSGLRRQAGPMADPQAAMAAGLLFGSPEFQHK